MRDDARAEAEGGRAASFGLVTLEIKPCPHVQELRKRSSVFREMVARVATRK